MCKQAQVMLACNPTSARHARTFCTETLTEVLGRTADVGGYADIALLVVSELVTNAFFAGCASTELQITVHHDRVHIGVYDDGAGWPQIQNPSVEESWGRGLLIVDQLSTRWGVLPTGHGKQVWAEIAIPIHLTDQLVCELVGD